ncbi:MAG: flagellar basal body rod protein FlgC [Lachnospiraceae bacterium]|jgi:flagellar basal-body rod protein FlgC|nr:flagellar basal body rod protein FlgC [Lachnospiraceae bacterium]
MGMFTAFNISASGLSAQRYRMDIISENIANANTTRTQDGTPYVRKVVTFQEKGSSPSFDSILTDHLTGQYMESMSSRRNGGGVKVSSVTEDTWTPAVRVYDPSHPDADEDGYVTGPNVNIIAEMTDLIDASRAYEANNTAFTAAKSMAVQGLQVGRQ